jgi:cytochrome b561
MTGRYNGWAIALHWTIAALILFQIPYAWWWMGALPDETPAHAQSMVLHMSIGLTILILSLARLGLRLAVASPPLPAGMAKWETILARTTHVLFYVLIIGIPIGGWVLASLGRQPITYFGLFEWPHLPGLSSLDKPARHAIGKPVGALHTSILPWATVLLLALHVGGALKDQLTGPAVLWRMIPFLRPSAGR